jgi:hypothetical protein
MILVFDGLAHRQSLFPYIQIGFNMQLYINVLFSRESLDFRPKSHDKYIIEMKKLTLLKSANKNK